MTSTQSSKRQMGGAAARLRVSQAGGGRAALALSMRNAGEPTMASSGRAVRESQAQKNPRFRIGDGRGNFLSCDGSGVVTNSRVGWFGSAAQAEKALAKFPAANGMHAIRIFPVKPISLEALRSL